MARDTCGPRQSPTSWSRYVPSFTRTPPILPSQVQPRAPAASTGTARDPTSEPSLRRTLSFSERIAKPFVQRSRRPSSDPSWLGEKARAAAGTAPDPIAEGDPGAPKSSWRIPALTIVALGAVVATTKRVDPLATAIHTPRSTNETVDHSRIGWVASYQVKPSA